MEAIPAIDIRDGKCVQLYQGDYDRETVFSDSPVDMARTWVERGATRLHVVDLDGAGHTLVVKTLTGHAQGVCEAIDQAQWPEAVGTLAGENTIFILCRSASQREALRSRIIDITGEL